MLSVQIRFNRMFVSFTYLVSFPEWCYCFVTCLMKRSEYCIFTGFNITAGMLRSFFPAFCFDHCYVPKHPKKCVPQRMQPDEQMKVLTMMASEELDPLVSAFYGKILKFPGSYKSAKFLSYHTDMTLYYLL